MTPEDEEFNRIERESKQRMEAVRDSIAKPTQQEQWAENVSKAYDLLAFGQTERAAEILKQTRDSLRSYQKKPQNCGTGYCSCIECVMK